MLGSSELIAFVATTDADRARAFYEGTLGLTLVSDDPFALVFDANGQMLRIAKVEELTPARHTVLGWTVSDIVAAATALSARGVTLLRFGGMGQDELGIWASPGGGRIAWFHDSDGNTLSLSEH
jgi:catechol 2,3-dioxygenase-like lactoylglutathione lyase family enzyme